MLIFSQNLFNSVSLSVSWKFDIRCYPYYQFLIKEIFYFQQLHVLILMNAKLTKMYVEMENVKTWWAHLIVFVTTDIQSKKN